MTKRAFACSVKDPESDPEVRKEEFGKKKFLKLYDIFPVCLSNNKYFFLYTSVPENLWLKNIMSTTDGTE